jgi:hypothetical protein
MVITLKECQLFVSGAGWISYLPLTSSGCWWGHLTVCHGSHSVARYVSVCITPVGTSHNPTGNPYSFRQTILLLRSGNLYSQRHSQSQSQSHFTTDGQSVSQSVLVSSPVRGSWPDIYFYFESYCPVYMGRPLWREDGSVICLGQSVVMSLVSIYTFLQVH